MADSLRDSGTGEEPEVRSDRGSPPRMPRWVKWPAIVIGVLVLVFVVLQLTGLGGEHGPGRHAPGGGAPQTSVSAVPTPPAGSRG